MLSSPSYAVQFTDIGKTFSPRRGSAPVSALEAVSFAVEQGRILGVIGRSGAGKSTLIRLLNGLEAASTGTLNLFGRDVTRLSEQEWRSERKEIGMIFQHFNLLSSRSVFGNVALPLELAGQNQASIAERVTTLLDLVGLSDKRNAYPSQLSGGQKQRVGIARALATEPRILLCDEATSALDPETTRSILALLKAINQKLGVTIVLITHEIGVIKEIADEVVVLDKGKVAEYGSAFDILTRPQAAVTKRLVEGVITAETPVHIAQNLHSEALPNDLKVLRVGFIGENATAPVISRLTTTIGVDVNILAGRIEFIGGEPFGSLIIAVPANDISAEAVQAGLLKIKLTVESLGYLSPSILSKGEGVRHAV